MARTRVSQFAKYQLNSLAFSHVMSLSMDYHTSKSTGKVITAIEQGTDLTYLVDTLFEVGPMIIDLLVAVIYLTKHFDSTVGLIVLIAAVFNAYVTWKGNKYTSKMERQFVENSQRQNTVLYDSISNWFTVAIHNRAKFEHQRFSQAVWKNLLTERRYYDASEVLWKSQEVLLDLGLYASCYVAAIRVVEGHSTISSFVFLTSYWDSITSPMSSLAHQFHETAAHLIRAEWLYQLLQTKPSVRDKTDARQLNISEGRVTFENVSFSYNPQRTILDNISFATEPGQAIALVGETGSGKSTILKLLWRFYDVTSGRICIDGQDIRDITLDSLRDSLGSVPQDPSVFDQTIMQNLLYARPLATEQDVFDACNAACIHDQIMSFPDGYQSKIGERGVRLSGGELQRLAIARVMIRRPKIVVLDEATSAVDSDTEANVQRAIKALSAGRTVFTVAHRLSTVVAADKILVIHKGEIVEQGTHHGLLVANGRYARLWAIQTASQETDRLVDDSVSG
jgi:ABC-type transport system involved in Fe-S cluster assembly fused permease/ATPase subunit